MPSVAVSYIAAGKNRDVAIRFLRRLVPLLLDGFLPPKTLLNVNIPAGEIKGVKVTRLGKRIYKDMAIKGTLPDGGVSWTIDGELAFEDSEGTDFEAVYSGYISVTPLHLDMTHHSEIERLQKTFSSLKLH
jgi:5'-nucleotidase